MSRGGGRGHTRVLTARKRTAQSTRWLERQLNDPYVKRAKAEGYRSRAAYKLIELDEKFGKRVFATAKKMGAETAEANVNAGLAAANQIVDFLKNGNTRFQVNK